MLCCPAKASEFSSRQVTASTRHVSLYAGWYKLKDPLPEFNSNQCPTRHRFFHFANSPHVLVRNWSPVFAVTVPLAWGRVDMMYKITIATSADFPIPCPEDTADRIGTTGSTPLNARSLIASPSARRSSSCHGSSPSMPASAACRQSTGQYAHPPRPSEYMPHRRCSSCSISSGSLVSILSPHR